MNFFIIFIKDLIKLSDENEIMALASELAFRLLLAFFPFVIFLMSLLGFFNVQPQTALNVLALILPQPVVELLTSFVAEVIVQSNVGILSVSLIASVISASTGFKAMMRGINKSYGFQDHRNYFLRRIIGTLLAIVFTAAVLLSLLFLIYRNKIYSRLIGFFVLDTSPLMESVFGATGYITTICLLLAAILLIFKLGTAKRIPIYRHLPGAAITLALWLACSHAFNLYTNNFSNAANVYGSLAGIIIMMIWLNAISATMLLGAEVNALIMNRAKTPAPKKP